MSAAVGPCAIDGCHRAISSPFVMCRDHWLMLDYAARGAIVREFKKAEARKSKEPTVEWRRLVASAISTVAQLEGRVAFDDGRPRLPVGGQRSGGFRVGIPGEEDE